MEHSQDDHKEVEGMWYHQYLLGSGRPSKLDDHARRRLIREATKRAMATLKELQAFMAKAGHCVHVTTIPQALHKFGLDGTRVEIRKPLLKKAHLESCLRNAKTTPEILKPCSEKFCGLMRPRWNILA